MARRSDTPEGEEGTPRRRALSPAERMRRTREKNAALTGEEAWVAAREVALRQLDVRQRSRKELLDALATRGFAEETALSVVDRLTELGLVDDAAFASALVRARFESRGAVGPALVQELRRKGLPADAIDAALAQVGRDDELDRARELVARKVTSMRGVSREAAWRRLQGMLARKGYGPGVSRQVIADALDGWSADGEERPWEELP